MIIGKKFLNFSNFKLSAFWGYLHGETDRQHPKLL